MTRVVTVLVLLAAAAGAVGWRLAGTKPDPNVQGIADGCQRDTQKIYTGFAPNWVYVNDRDFPSSGPTPVPQWLTGVVKGASGLLASRVSSSDDPITHRSFDVNIDVTVDRPDDYLTGVSRDTTPEAGTLHLERETADLPMWTWPRPGNAISAMGSWVWDCDHFQGRGEKTEFHPFRALWIDRKQGEGDLYVSSDATPAGKEAECAHETKGSDAFKACAHGAANFLSVDGNYAFDLAAPTAPCVHPQIRSVNRGDVNAPRIATTWTGKAWHLGFKIATTRRTVTARQFFATCANTPRPIHLRLRFDKLLVRRAMDPSCPPDKPSCPYAPESTLLGQITTPPGEWQVIWSVDGIWGRWPGTLAARDGSVFRGRQYVDFSAQRGKPWTFVALARECDFGAVPSWDGPGHALASCPVSSEVGNAKGDDYPGAITVTYRNLGLGRHVVDASTAGSSCPTSNVHGCYQLTYTVRRVS